METARYTGYAIGGEDCWTIIFSWFREYNLQRKPGIQEGSTEEEEMKQQQRMKVMKDMGRKIRAKGRKDANNSWWVSEFLAAAPSGMGRYYAEMARLVVRNEKEG